MRKWKSNKNYCVPCCFKINKGKDWGKVDAGIEKDRTQVDPKCSSGNENSVQREDIKQISDDSDKIPERIKNVCNDPLAYNNFPIDKSKLSHIPLNVKLLFKINSFKLILLPTTVWSSWIYIWRAKQSYRSF